MLNGYCLHGSENKNLPNMDIVPEIYGDYLASAPSHYGLTQLYEGFKKEQVTFIKEFTIGNSRKY